jgi:peptidoglycan hydrolase-like protein with peptidoglycan-binding domain
MPLISNLFRNNKRLQSCLVSDPAHVTPGSTGEHVRLIQFALLDLDSAEIAPAELDAQQYGSSTASAVLAFKRKRNIINRAYRSTPDNVVGKMTIAALDSAMYERQYTPRPRHGQCPRGGVAIPPVSRMRIRLKQPSRPVAERR